MKPKPKPKPPDRLYDYIIVATCPRTGIQLYLTERRTLSWRRKDAVRWQMKELAKATVAGYENQPGFNIYLWSTEFIPAKD